MKVSKDLQMEILWRLYKAYPNCLFEDKLRKASMPEPVTLEEIQGACIYLQDKGRVVKTNDGWKITASGIDFLEEQNLV